MGFVTAVTVLRASPLELIHTEFFLFSQDCGNWPAMAVDTQAVLVAAFQPIDIMASILVVLNTCV